MDTAANNAQLFARIAAMLDALEQRRRGRPLWSSLLYDAHCALQDLPPAVASRLDWYVSVLGMAYLAADELTQQDMAAEWAERCAAGEPLTSEDLPTRPDAEATLDFALRGVRALLPPGTTASALPTERAYVFTDEPRGQALDELFDLARATCSTFELLHPTYAQAGVPDALEAFRLVRDAPNDRPHLAARFGRRYWFRFDGDSSRTLRGCMDGLYARLGGLEDLTLRRAPGFVWLEASTHEASGALHLRPDERAALATAAPRVDACLARDAVFG